MSSARIQAFLDALLYERQLADKTRSTYALSLEEASRELGNDLPNASSEALQEYLNRLRRKGLSPTTLNRHRAALKTFFKWQHTHHLRDDDPAEALQIPKIHNKHLPKALTPDEITQLLTPPADDDALRLRNYAMFELAYSGGLRLAELVALDLPQVARLPDDLIIRGKGGYERRIFIGSRAKTALKRWFQQRQSLAKADEKALFVSKLGTRITERSVELALNHYAQTRLPGRHLTPHMLRHSFASHLLQSSGDIRGVQDLLGHRNISTTQIYTHLDFQQLAKIYDKAHPRAKKHD